MRFHLELYAEQRERKVPLAGLRSRLMWYSKRLPKSARLRAELGKCREVKAMIEACEGFFANLDQCPHNPDLPPGGPSCP